MNHNINAYCAECGEEEGGVSLKACTSCMLVKYCNIKCQRKHWPKHKHVCKRRAAELHDEALFKDPPAKEECPICFLPMPVRLMCCVSLPPATITSVPVFDFACAHRDSVNEAAEEYYECCGKSICKGCVYSFILSGNNEKCPYCKAERINKTDEGKIEELMKRVEANDASAIYLLGSYYSHGQLGLQRSPERKKELWTQAAKLGSSQAHFHLGNVYSGVDLKKEKFHYEAAAMAGNDVARNNLGGIEGNSGNMDRAMKHLIIAASAGNYQPCKACEKSLLKKVLVVEM